MLMIKCFFCRQVYWQARVQVLSPKSKPKEKEEFGLRAVSIILWATHPNNKTQRVKVTQYDPLYQLSTKKTGGQQEGEHGWVQHVQGEQYQRNVLRVFMIERGLVGDPELSLVHRRSPKSINQSPNLKFLGLSLSTPVWLELKMNWG